MRTDHEVFSGGRIIREYRVALGKNPVGPKRMEGDGRTPEGDYGIDYRNPGSRYHRSLHISYPDSRDVEAAEKGSYDPGGDIVIHGIRNGFG
jgi:murein L,D-transpeptidase YafK